MSHFFPRAEYAEDQPLARTILATHVLSRGFQVGTAVGLLKSGAAALFKNRPITTLSLLRSASAGGAVGTGVVGVGLIIQMWGREKIEWQDRSWRLRYNPGQLGIDNWSEPVAALGALAVAFRRPLEPTIGVWRGVVGGMGIGSLVGIVGCLCATHILLPRKE
ncbi:hypothetical protein N7448_000435 [Penicillium atrosanguineum]|uniref:Uncharacterized protein n=1 Tax=Penicillium atrosanguineum TaxID=1132637 RepID=A0A9W9Q4V4_9EURO|nr:uncharacterized protein N7443_003832 [Penicillium atrosanguineum]KAJ5148857.1 hypothetical protein N7448_000435 [Penicillium atrosanguineum]KAJ5304172.1 hypothetical protein N7443_003832 [Penicillium atrosanguineum]KAJ5323648.1 hypothetical protein N7476_002248 [Penicillium atrosanguineum]